MIEYTGEGISTLSMDQRMTICNMSIEGGARAGLIAPDEVTFDYIRGRPLAPSGEELEKTIEYWKSFLAILKLVTTNLSIWIFRDWSRKSLGGLIPRW